MSGFPVYTLAETSGTEIEQLGDFEDILKGVENNGFANKVPENKSEAFDMTHQKIRIQTIAGRLYLLGYLRRKFNPKRIHRKIEKIKEAVLAFQKDANLTQDSWVGNETWYALDELVSFESTFTHEKWFVDGHIKPEVKNAMHRAIQLRLWCLGLFSRKPRPKFKLLTRKSLFAFTRILHIFLMRKKSFAGDFNPETLGLLFNQEGLVHAIKKRCMVRKNSFKLNLSVENKDEYEILSKVFLVNCAKIELWLLGFEVRIDGRKNYDYAYGSDIWNALAKFHREFEGRSTHKAEELARHVTPKLFVSLGNALKSEEAYKDDDASEEIAQELFIKDNVVQTTSNIEYAWNYIKEKGMRLWDGLKRVWRWIKKIGRKVVAFVQNNLFKAFYRFVSKSLKIVMKGIGAIVKSVAIYVKGGMVTKDMFFKFSKDFDTSVYTNENISVTDSEAGSLALLKQTTAFKLGCKMVGYLFFFFKNLTLGLFGWAKILFSLLKSYKELRVLYHDFKFIAS
ncbi:peptidoglycan-binding domain-containing protein [Kordia sp.]|uniref:peptidoglycan-binding domain-containing protein n=1 Tax=Kordia sp. TaxID=1965332 RepID=UPI003D2B0EEA